MFANSKDSHLKMSSGSAGDVLQQVSQVWSMLDDLSESDPAAYRSFMDKQMQAGGELTAPPELHTCLRTEVQVSSLCSFINVY